MRKRKRNKKKSCNTQASGVFSSVVCLFIRLLSSSNAFILSESNPPANCKNTIILATHIIKNICIKIDHFSNIFYLMNTKSKSHTLKHQKLSVWFFLGSIQRIKFWCNPLHVFSSQLHRRKLDLEEKKNVFYCLFY